MGGTLTLAVASRLPPPAWKYAYSVTATLVAFCSSRTVVWLAVLFHRGMNTVVS